LISARHLAQGLAARATLALARAVPPGALAAAVSFAARTFARRRIVRRSLRQVEAALGATTSPRQRLEIVRRMLEHLGRIVGECARFAREGQALACELVAPDASLSRLEAAAAAGRGVVVLTPHFGNWELMPAWFIANGYHGVVVANRLANPLFDAFLLAARAKGGVPTVYQDESARKLVRALQGGGVVGILPDQDIDHLPGTFVPFFGKPAYTVTGPAALARASSAPLLPAFLEWEGRRYRLSFEEPIHVPRTRDRDADILSGTRAWTRAFEERIRARPDHWMWFHARWKTTPERLRRRGRERLLLAPLLDRGDQSAGRDPRDRPGTGIRHVPLERDRAPEQRGVERHTDRQRSPTESR
jgi:KDO2-lipid IV(A) lauroyltransferase